MSENRSPDSTTPRRAWRSPRAWVVLLLVLAAGLSADLWLKSWSFEHIAEAPVTLDRDTLLANPDFNPVPRHDGRQALPFNLLQFRLVVNRGAVFGIGANQRGFFIAFTCVALIAGICVFGFWTTRRSTLAHVAIAMILAGGLGNLYDRMAFGVVRDYLHMLPSWKLPFGLTWGSGGTDELFPWVFNLADVMLLVGMGLLMIQLHRSDSRRKPKEKTGEKSKTTGAVKAIAPAAADSPQPEPPSTG